MHGVRKFSATDPDLVDLVAAFTARPPKNATACAPQWLDDVVSKLRASWHPGIHVAEIATGAGVHPVYLARCFRRWYGRGVAEELRRLRFKSATAALTQTDATVSCIAHRFGYADESHLCRELKQTVGIPPRRFRSLVGQLR